jgi:anti-sigma factor RsiW
MMKQYDDCAEIENSLPLFVGGDLDLPAADEVARHLAGCPACQERERAARKARELMVSAFAMSERQGPALWPGVRAGLVREGVLQPQVLNAAPRAPRRFRLVPLAAAAAAVLVGVWLARVGFDAGGPFGPRTDGSAEPIVVERITPAPHQTPVIDVQPVRLTNGDALHPVGRHERRLREGAEVYGELPLGAVLGTGDDTWTKPVNLRH